MSNVALRRRLAKRSHTGSQLKRSDVFGQEDPLRPIYSSFGPRSSQIDVPAMGMVGGAYEKGGLAFVSVNPAGGKSDAGSRPVDDAVYEAIEALRDATSDAEVAAHFERLAHCFIAAAPTWSIWRQYLDPILDALSRDFSSTAYLYLVPFRTKGDAGSSMRENYFIEGFSQYLRYQLDDVSPKLIIAVDRPSERYCRRWSQDSNADCEVVYFTRKRDAHSERRKILEVLRSRHRHVA